eukprot:jgi/Hompol1/5632/HPOL_001998-RA
MSLNTAPLAPDRTPIWNTGEKVFLSQANVGFEFDSGTGGYPGEMANLYSKDGHLYISENLLIAGGGIKQEEGQIKFTFNAGGGFEFSSSFVQLRSRLGDDVAPYEEPLPIYESLALTDDAPGASLNASIAGPSGPSDSLPPPPPFDPASGMSGPASSSAAPPLYDDDLKRRPPNPI